MNVGVQIELTHSKSAKEEEMRVYDPQVLMCVI